MEERLESEPASKRTRPNQIVLEDMHSQVPQVLSNLYLRLLHVLFNKYIYYREEEAFLGHPPGLFWQMVH